MKHRALLVALLLLPGCSTTGPAPEFSAYVTTLPSVGEDKARAFFYRTGDHFRFSAHSARIQSDDKTIGECGPERFSVIDIPADTRTLTVDIWDFPGSCELPVELEPGGDYFYEIEPRSAFPSGLAFLIGFAAWPGGGLFESLTGGFLAAGTESAVWRCGGAFTVGPVAPETAKEALNGLRLTE